MRLMPGMTASSLKRHPAVGILLIRGTFKNQMNVKTYILQISVIWFTNLNRSLALNT